MRCWTREQEGPIAILELTRPPINALDQNALEELACQLSEIDSDSSRVLVITGGLDGVFCTGGDLKFWRAVSDPRSVSRAGRDVFDRLAQMTIPTIAAINGHVIGDGLGLALACDLRIASERATFRLPEAAYGFIPGWGTVRELVALIGRARSADLLLTGRPLDARGALAIGLVGEVVAADDIVMVAFERGRALSEFSGSALSAMKCALRGGDDRACFEGVWGSPDWQEGIEALLAKRPPHFVRQGGSSCCPQIRR
jgi:enoyl-CoA hydratase/carnithine racemase